MSVDIITPIKDQLEIGFHNHCRLFMLIGTRSETPRFFNLGDKDDVNKRFKIQSTQKSDLFFWIDSPNDNYYDNIAYGDIHDIWAQIKQFRTQFLLENYPTISPY